MSIFEDLSDINLKSVIKFSFLFDHKRSSLKTIILLHLFSVLRFCRNAKVSSAALMTKLGYKYCTEKQGNTVRFFKM